jgi:ATP-dependent DNA helicase HFM1/MER3
MWQAVSWSEIDPDISKVVQHVSCIKLRKFLPRKIGFHHADLAPYDRSIVEELFRNRKLSVLCCTSTLAMGVNLPAHLVVIKSTAQVRSIQLALNDGALIT